MCRILVDSTKLVQTSASSQYSCLNYKSLGYLFINYYYYSFFIIIFTIFIQLDLFF